MSRRKLLLADDSITIQKVVNLTFADEGIEVIAVGDGNTAFDRMQETPPDLVMADVNMPGLGGYELCERIKQTERLRHIPVILLVGSFEPFDEAEAARVGADDFLTKPFQSIRQLVNKVTGMLESTERRRASAGADSPSVIGFVDSPAAGNAETFANDFAADEVPVVYNEAATDDEMIQTSSVESFSLDESHKFESRTFDADDAGKTQPLSARDLKDFAFVEESARESHPAEQTFEASNEYSAEQPSESTSPNSPAVYGFSDAPPAPARPVFDFDDLNMLEIPFDEQDEMGDEAESESSSYAVSETDESSAETELQTEILSGVTDRAENIYASSTGTEQRLSSDAAEEFVEEIKEAEEGKTIAESEAETESDQKNAGSANVSAGAANFSFPPEVIEAIAQRVAEMLSARTASEVAPQVADLIMQKMAEEKLKQ